RDTRPLGPDAMGDAESTQLPVELERPATLDRTVATTRREEEAQLVGPDRNSFLTGEQDRIVGCEGRARRSCKGPIPEGAEVALPGLGHAEDTDVTERDVAPPVPPRRPPADRPGTCRAPRRKMGVDPRDD